MIVSCFPLFEHREALFNTDMAPSYYWAFLKHLHSFSKGDLAVIADERYFSDPDFHYPKGSNHRMSAEQVYEYATPSWEDVASCYRYTVPREKQVYVGRQGIRRFLAKSDPTLVDYYTAVFKDIKNSFSHIDYVMSPTGNPSLMKAAVQENVKVVHFEKGPLRMPIYKETAFFDFSGLVEGTDVLNRWKQFCRECDNELIELLSLEQIRALLTNTPEASSNNAAIPQNSIGIALQDEWDTNIVAYNNGITTEDLLFEGRSFFPANEISIRYHPASRVSYNTEMYGQIDSSSDSREFVKKCKEIWTINSSVGVEAILHEKKVKIFGKHALKDILEVFDATNDMKRLVNFLFINYLTPWSVAFNQTYCLWRISNPSEAEIFKWHLKYYHKNMDITFNKSTASAETEQSSRSKTRRRRYARAEQPIL